MNYFALMITVFLLPLVMILCGMSYTKKGGPKRINKVSGYRTKMSMKNRETWDFAHKYLGDLWFKLGTPLLALTSVMTLIIFRQSDEKIMFWCVVVLVIHVVIMVLPVYYTEKALKANFDENGKWRSKEAKEQWLALEAKRQEARENEK